ncbi:hypothetical protein GGX14DRAFT_562468 [Mycena pura]|uniref:Uncharacterized protein n=1 Tax=Mycena pura TaxID=153505 RepID=A0AAD6YIH6_9AGAR|nr:hypothetical protein GGX14DRAFT_562468 [Mycena pura]
MYTLSTYDWAVDVHLLRDELRLLLRLRRSGAALARPRAAHRGQHCPPYFATMLGDIVVCWRVYVMYGQSKSVLAMAAALLALFCTGIITCNVTQIGKGFPPVMNLHRLVPKQLQIDMVTLMLSTRSRPHGPPRPEPTSTSFVMDEACLGSKLPANATNRCGAAAGTRSVD